MFGGKTEDKERERNMKIKTERETIKEEIKERKISDFLELYSTTYPSRSTEKPCATTC